MDNFEKENQEILKHFLDRKFFNSFKIDKKDKISADIIKGIELFITTDCNLNCSYCYLQKQNKGLYPIELRDHAQIIINLKLFLNWFIEQEFKTTINIFSGEFFSLGRFGFNILDIIYDQFKDIDKTKSELYGISIPTNMTFISDDILTTKVGSYVEKFKEIGIQLSLSASIDGKFLETKTRPLRNGKEDRDDEYYDRLFTFIAKYKIGVHPMVSSYGIEKWQENYKWFSEQLEKYCNNKSPMMLEVRDNDWTDDSIKEYLKYLNDVVDYEFKYRHNSNKEDFAMRVFIKNIVGYDTITLKNNIEGISCAIQKTLYIRLGDLSIVPCHRLSYGEFNYGKFIVEDNKIKDIEPINTSLCTTIYSMNPKNQPKCEKCEFSKWCVKGCLGSQYETSQELFIPNDSVCKLYKSKIVFLFKKYYSLGIIDAALKLNINPTLKEDIKEMTRRYCQNVKFSE